MTGDIVAKAGLCLSLEVILQNRPYQLHYRISRNNVRWMAVERRPLVFHQHSSDKCISRLKFLWVTTM